MSSTPFFLETDECKQRMTNILHHRVQQRLQQNESIRKEIKEAKKYCESIAPKIEMSKEELRAEIEEQKKIREKFEFSKSLQMEEEKIIDAIQSLKDDVAIKRCEITTAQSKMRSNISSQKIKLAQLTYQLELKEAEHRAWLATYGSDFEERIRAQKEKNTVDKKILDAEYMELMGKIRGACTKFNKLATYIENQLKLDEAIADDRKIQEELREKKEEFQRLRMLGQEKVVDESEIDF